MLPMADAAFDCVISNGVINLSADKARVFAEVARALRPGGRLAVADIVTEKQLTDTIIGNAELWAACVGGAAGGYLPRADRVGGPGGAPSTAQ